MALMGACTVLPLAIDGKATAPRLDGFGAATLVPSQANEAARQLFAQGMAQVYAFNEEEAIRAFKAALAQDPACAMCAWGVALELGPNINRPTRANLAEAIGYVDHATRHSQGASARDQALIGALALRYGHAAARTIAPPAAEICRSGSGTTEVADPLDIAYAAYMQSLAARFPADPDVLTLYAEAEMVATKGDWWDQKTGKPAGRIGELADLLEAGLKRHPDHVGLNHYMIHAVDDVPVAARALASADRLGALAPKSPHLLHMPSHTYGHVGRYADSTRVNQLAVAADEAMQLELKNQKFANTKDWRRHNTHVQWYAALMEGRGELALKTARASAASAQRDHEAFEYNRSLPILTLLQLQRWDAVLKEPMPWGDKGVATVLGELARGIAMVRTGKLDDARAALERLKPKARMLLAKNTGNGFGPELVRSLAGSAEAQLGAEIAFAENRIEAALLLQTQAVELANKADHHEPPHLAGGPLMRLGEMQMRAKRFAAAEQNFRTDLLLHPHNGWGLQGLEKALAAQNKTAEAGAARRDLAASWAMADRQVRPLN